MNKKLEIVIAKFTIWLRELRKADRMGTTDEFRKSALTVNVSAEAALNVYLQLHPEDRPYDTDLRQHTGDATFPVDLGRWNVAQKKAFSSQTE